METQLAIIYSTYLLIRGDWHFWTIPAEMFNYALLPALVVLISLVYNKKQYKASLLFITPICLLTTYVYDSFMHAWLKIPSIKSDGRIFKNSLNPGAFLVGVYAAYCYHNANIRSFLQHKATTVISDFSNLIILAIFLLSTQGRGVSFFSSIPSAWSARYLYAILSSILILTTVVNPDGIVGRLFRIRSLRHIGTISFGMYLFHHLVLHDMRQLSLHLRSYLPPILSSYCYSPSLLNLIQFICTSLISYLIAYAAYITIEKPFLKMKKKTSAFQVKFTKNTSSVAR